MALPWESDPIIEAAAQPEQQAMAIAPDAPIDAPIDARVDAALPWAADPVEATDPLAPPELNLFNETRTVGGFKDELPPEVMSKLKPEQIAQWQGALKPGVTGQQLSDLMGSFGFNLQNAEDVAKAVNMGTPLNEAFEYRLPDVDAGDGALGAGVRGAADTVSMGAMNKLNAAATAVGDVLRGERGFSDSYNAQLDYNNAVEQRDETEHPYARIAGQLVGGMALPTGLQTVGARAGALAMREARAAGSSFDEAMLIGREAASRAVRQRMTAEGAGYGAAYGAGSADSLGEAATGAVTGAAIGGGGGAALGTVAGAVAPRAVARAARVRAEPLSDGQRTMMAADRLGTRFDDLEINPLPADVGGPLVRRATSATAQTITGASPIVEGGQQVAAQGEAIRNRVATMIGRVLRPEAAGQEGIRGARGFIARTSAEGNRLYREAGALAGDARVVPDEAVQVLQTHIDELAETPGGSAGLARLEALRDALAGGNVSVRGMRNMRTALRDDFAENGLRGSDIERRVNQVIDATTTDIVTSLRNQGRPEAARAYQVADRYWRNRLRTIDSVIEPIIGKGSNPKSGEQVVKAIKADLQGNNQRAVAFLRTLGPGEAADVRASLIGSMGRSTKGTQNADGDAFSLSSFLTHWDEIGETAKRAYFGPEGRAALNDLARVAQGTKEAQRYANHSNSGGALGNLAIGATALPSAGASLFLPYVSGRLLASPRFARWLARAPSTTLGQSAYVERLGRIARAEPAIATDVLALQRRLTDAFEPSRLAADDTTDK